jgi:hypothetical protein
MKVLGSVWPRPSRAVPRERKPQQNRSGRFLLLTLGSGAIAALLALAIEGLPVVMGQLIPPTSTQLDATTLFPTPGPQHKTVDVYDPPPQGTERESGGAPTPRRTPIASPSPNDDSGSPRPTPSPDD